MEILKKIHKKAIDLKVGVGLFGAVVDKYTVTGEYGKYSCGCGKEDCEHIVAVMIQKKERFEIVENRIPNGCVKGLSRFDVVSAFHKELRRGDYERSSYWLEIMLQSNLGAFYLNNYIIGIVPEELCLCSTPSIQAEMKALASYKILDEYALYTMVDKFCSAKKWWECDRCSYRRDIWVKNHLEVQNDVARRMPLYVFDTHTAKGKKLHAEGNADNRWAGTNLGMTWRRRAIMAGLDILEAKWEDVDMADSLELENIDKVW